MYVADVFAGRADVRVLEGDSTVALAGADPFDVVFLDGAPSHWLDRDTFDGSYPGDALDEALAEPEDRHRPHGTTWTGRPSSPEPDTADTAASEPAIRPPERPTHQNAT